MPRISGSLLDANMNNSPREDGAVLDYAFIVKCEERKRGLQWRICSYSEAKAQTGLCGIRKTFSKTDFATSSPANHQHHHQNAGFAQASIIKSV